MNGTPGAGQTMPEHGWRRRRDRRGRGLRGPLLDHRLPAARTRRERFDDLVVELARDLARQWPPVAHMEFAVEDVPPSDPSPWETGGVPLGRLFSADRRTRLADRIVIYRRPCEMRSAEGHEREELVYAVLVEQVARALGRSPDEIAGR
ncbi:metallopeptidase family protein [Buchananella hordeovulneris]|uniref:metallopeptidase family protein n=1 Tax=Buchananella hordeovulneris TaxID=52770 RepID=UPI0031830B3B